MKKVFSNKIVIGLLIAAVAGGIAYYSTWGNRKWLIRKLGDEGASIDDKKTTSELRQDLLKAIKAA